MKLTKKEIKLLDQVSDDLHDVFGLRKEAVVGILKDLDGTSSDVLTKHYEENARDLSHKMMQSWHRWEQIRSIIYDQDREDQDQD